MRGARRLGALFLFVASLVVASEHDDLLNSMINKGFTATVDSEGNPILVKMMVTGVSGNILDKLDEKTNDKNLEDIEFAREWLSLVASLGRAGHAAVIGEAKLTPLHVASMHGLVEEARALLELDADIDETDIKERTALHHAAMKGHLDVVELLLEWDADIDATDENGSTPLQVVGKMGPGGTRRSVLRRLRRAAGLDDSGVDSFDTALTWVNKMITEGKPHARNRNGRTVLHVAATWGLFGEAELLLQLGADVDATAPEGAQPLHLAAYYDKEDVAKVLLREGADVDARTEFSAETPLHYASKQGSVKLIQLLIEHDAALDAEDMDREIPLEVAADAETKEVLMDAMQQKWVDKIRDLSKKSDSRGVARAIDELVRHFKYAGVSKERIMRVRRELKGVKMAPVETDPTTKFYIAIIIAAVVAACAWGVHRLATATARAERTAARLERELLEGYAPAARGSKRRGAKTRRREHTTRASVPVWATLLRVAVCCAGLYLLVLDIQRPETEAIPTIFTFVCFFPCMWKGFRTILCLAPVDRIWGRVGADAWLLFNFMIIWMIWADRRYDTLTAFYDQRFFYAVPLPVAVLGACAVVYDAGNWLHECLASNRPRQAGDALRELRCDWAPRARAAAVAWAEGVLKRDIQNEYIDVRWILILLVGPVVFAAALTICESMDYCQSHVGLGGFSVICGVVLGFDFFVKPVAAAFVWACVADRPLEAEPAAGKPAPESEEESEAAADESTPTEDSDSGSEPEAAAEAAVEPTPEPAVTEPPPADEAKSDVPAPAREAKVEEEPACEPAVVVEEAAPTAEAPPGYELVASVLAHLGLSSLLPSFVGNYVDDEALVALEPEDFRELGVELAPALAIMAAVGDASRARKKLATEDILDGVARHQSVLEETLREHRAEIERLRIERGEIPDDLRCPLTLELFKDPVMARDGHTYERVAIVEWLKTKGTSPMTQEPLDAEDLVPQHIVRKLIDSFLDSKRRRRGS